MEQIWLDACAIVNLYASRRMKDLLKTLGPGFAITEVVAAESQYVLRGGDGDDAHERERIDLEPFLNAGLLEQIRCSDDSELLTFIDLTLELDQGEAQTAAMAIHRGGIVVTDDRKASRLLQSRGVRQQSSQSLFKRWVELGAIGRSETRSTLMHVQERGRYEPSRGHHLRDWWDEMLASRD